MLFIKWSNNSESWVVRKKDTILSKGLEAELNQAKVSDFSRGFSMNGRWFRKITGEIVKFESWRLELKLGDNGENKPLKFGRNRKWGATVALKLVGDWHDKSRCFGKIGVLICCSVTQLCLTLCDPIDCSMPDFPVLHHLPELAQTHVHWVSDAIQPSRPLLFPSPSAFSFSQHQGPSIQGCSWR